tara:strand:+ start:5846 stop:6847 length:1002 start_codon:yes stop_codon:yes gene_type:complete
MATPPPNIFGMERLTGEAVSQPKVSQAVRRLLLESRRATQINSMLVDELASGVLSSGAAQQVGREMQKNQSIARFNSRMAVAKNAEEQATKGRGAAIAQSLIGATGTLAAQYISSDPGETGDATVAGMDKAFEETISPGDLTVPGGAAARLQAQAAQQASQSQLGVPALDVDPGLLVRAAPDISAINQFGERGSARTIDPGAPPDARLPSIAGQYRQQELPSVFGVEEQFSNRESPKFSPRSARRGYAPSFAPEALGKTSFDARVDAARAYPQVDQFPDISSRSKEDKALMGIKEEPDVAKLISDAMALKDKEEQRKALRKIMRQYGDGMGGE